MRKIAPLIRRRRSGFTLFELVVAMTMVTILAATFYTTLHVAFRATEEADAALDPPRTAQLALDYVGDDLRNAILPAAGTLAVSFEGTQASGGSGGEADDIVFYSTTNAATHVDGNGDIKEVELTVQSVNDENVLVRNVLSALPNQNTNATVTADQEVICRNVISFTVQYYDGSSWYQVWDSTAENNTLPAAVKVALVLERPISRGSTQMQQYTYTRTYMLACSTAAQDPTVNTGGGDDSGDN